MSALSSTVSQQLGPVKAIPVTGVSSGMAGGADLILTKAWRPPSECCQWSVHYLGDINTCGNRFGESSNKLWVSKKYLGNLISLQNGANMGARKKRSP